MNKASTVFGHMDAVVTFFYETSLNIFCLFFVSSSGANAQNVYRTNFVLDLTKLKSSEW